MPCFLVKCHLYHQTDESHDAELHPIYQHRKGEDERREAKKRIFDALTQSIPDGLYICPKVRIADLIETHLLPTDPNYWKTIAPINQKHVDFILVNRSDFAPRAAIELDGGSHKDQARERRDIFVSSVFQSAGIPLLHVPVQGFYHYNTLREQITTAITTQRE